MNKEEIDNLSAEITEDSFSVAEKELQEALGYNPRQKRILKLKPSYITMLMAKCHTLGRIKGIKE